MNTLNSDFQVFLKANKFDKISFSSMMSVLQLHEEGATVPFMARYRKEKTGNLDEVEIRAVIENHEAWQEIVKRKKFVLAEVQSQGNLTPEFEKQISNSYDLNEIEELYRPFKKKKKTKATLAKEAGLEPLAQWIWDLGRTETSSDVSLEVKAKEFVNVPSGFVTYEEVLRGAQHILVEKLYSDTDLRKSVREDYFQKAILSSTKGKKYKEHSKFESYVDYKEGITHLQNPRKSHRYLALRRGWQEGELTVSISSSDEELLAQFENYSVPEKKSQAAPFLKNCAKVALTVHVVPSVVNEVHHHLKELADKHAIQVFAENLRRVLMGSPFGSKVTLGVDPGLRTGCKLALVDKSGQFISSTVLQILGENAFDNAKNLFAEVTRQIDIQAIAVGNGTGGREAEEFLRKVLKEINVDVPVVLVNESGASVYSASEIAREEFPELDLTVRGAISIARRLQDPLAELVKIDPKSIGVGQYQHDVSQNNLKKSLYEVVESCVNQVGVDINTASKSLLQYVSGIGPKLAENLIVFRKEKGLFKDRNQLLSVPNFSGKTFEQAAGFLRITESERVLDRTGIHPERYTAVTDMAKELGVPLSQLLGAGAEKLLVLKEKWQKLVGEFTFNDIIEELKKPGRDPRDPYQIFQFREDIHEVKDLQKDMICPGIVTNVTNFGAFVDVGVHQDGLVHLSQISHEFIDDPKKVLSPGDQVKVKVLDVDLEKMQIAFTMLLTEKPPSKVVRSKEKRREDSRQRVKSEGASDKQRTGRNPAARKPSGKGKDVNVHLERAAHKSSTQSAHHKHQNSEKRGHKGSPKDQKSRGPQRTPFNNPFANLNLNIKK